LPGRPSKKGAALQAGLQSQLEAYPDATLTEHCHLWETTQGVQVSSATISRAIQRLGWTRKKKTLRASEQKEADRAAWRTQAQTLDAGKLVFLDECGSNIALTRLYGRSPKGKRACGAVPRNRRALIIVVVEQDQMPGDRAQHDFSPGKFGCNRLINRGGVSTKGDRQMKVIGWPIKKKHNKRCLIELFRRCLSQLPVLSLPFELAQGAVL